MFNNNNNTSKIKQLEHEIEELKKILGVYVTESSLYYPWITKFRSKKLEALEKYLNIDYKEESKTEGYVKREEKSTFFDLVGNLEKIQKDIGNRFETLDSALIGSKSSKRGRPKGSKNK